MFSRYAWPLFGLPFVTTSLIFPWLLLLFSRHCVTEAWLWEGKWQRSSYFIALFACQHGQNIVKCLTQHSSFILLHFWRWIFSFFTLLLSFILSTVLDLECICFCFLNYNFIDGNVWFTDLLLEALLMKLDYVRPIQAPKMCISYKITLMSTLGDDAIR